MPGAGRTGSLPAGEPWESPGASPCSRRQGGSPQSAGVLLLSGAHTATSGRTDPGTSRNSCQRAAKMHRKSLGVGGTPTKPTTQHQTAKHRWALPWLCRGDLSGRGG